MPLLEFLQSEMGRVPNVAWGLAMDLPPDDDGPAPGGGASSRRSKGKPRKTKRVAPRVLQLPRSVLLQLPQLPGDIDGDLPEELVGQLALDGPVHGPAGRAARLMPRKPKLK